MRIILVILAFTSFISVHAQTHFPVSGMDAMQPDAFNHYNHLTDSNILQKKWSINSYTGIAAGAGFFNSGNIAFLPAQIGLQINRRLNNNLYAFAGVSAAPVLFNFNRSFSDADLHRNYMLSPGFNANGLGIYTGIRAGLMFVNDEKTFSISGSIGVSNSTYPYHAPRRVNTQKQSAFSAARQ